MKQLYLFPLLTLVFFSSCKQEKRESNFDLEADSIPKITEVHTEADCEGLSDLQFCHEGLSFVRVNEYLSGVDTVPEAIGYGDTLFSESVDDATYTWEGLKLVYPKGIVILEGDFNRSEFVNRIQILTPEFRSKKGLGVGSTIEEIKKIYPTLYVSALPAYGFIEVKPSNQLIFLFEASEELLTKETLSLKDLPSGAAAKRVVIM